MDAQTRLPLAVVAVSGGMDSCVTAAIAAGENRLALLHVTYGQRTAERERRSFEAIADFYRVPPNLRLAVDIAHLARIGGSSLTDRSVPVRASGVAGEGGIPSSYVPFRNAHILSIAVSWAEVIGASSVWIGAVEQDSSGYPDCRPAFYEAFQKAVDLGTKPETHIRIQTPVIGMTKGGVVRRGTELRAPLHLTWSCYQNEDVACGKCDSCLLRLRGFKAAGVPDPIPYERG